ncbi:2TM domain-containing protein [Rothia uropygialis]|uniref:2TM domain-containing protein n=1 Tax=Kocuria sp. 36 TaxID=1415402 RepID=UPI00101C4FEF|nr:2TM domain-containing protein [Kocuria sp. 36]
MSASAQIICSTSTRAHLSLLPFALSLIGSNILFLLRDNRINAVSTTALGGIAVGYTTYLLTVGRKLNRIRYGSFVAHALTYGIFNVGYLLHAYFLVALNSPAILTGGEFPLDPHWLGATLGMASFWGIGLIAHGIGAVVSRGFEASRP